MDIDSYLSLDPTGNNGVLRMVNIYGFFIEGMGNVDRNTGAITMAANGSSVIGRIMNIPGMGVGASYAPRARDISQHCPSRSVKEANTWLLF